MDHHQKLMISSLGHKQHMYKILLKSVNYFVRYLANRQTDRQTDKRGRKHNLLGGGKYMKKNTNGVSISHAFRDICDLNLEKVQVVGFYLLRYGPENIILCDFTRFWILFLKERFRSEVCVGNVTHV